MSTLRALVLAAALLVLAILFAILACTVVVDRNARPLLPLLFSLLTPLPLVLCGRPHGGFTDESLLDVVGPFLGGALAVAGPALTCVLYHTGSIVFAAFLLSIASEAFLASTACVLASASPSDESREYDL
ncbi:Vacuolar protein sorting 55 [Trypanosoma melophagium]|uniref:Vacuolar protein sorting 55 n=1 Tax=Trypanosoma melophagium TaxID=715481 RepID=UPI00351A31C1|nr:Vacuolar protein sorting 55 [Trypanosoma melophagium]